MPLKLHVQTQVDSGVNESVFWGPSELNSYRNWALNLHPYFVFLTNFYLMI